MTGRASATALMRRSGLPRTNARVGQLAALDGAKVARTADQPGALDRGGAQGLIRRQAVADLRLEVEFDQQRGWPQRAVGADRDVPAAPEDSPQHVNLRLEVPRARRGPSLAVRDRLPQRVVLLRREQRLHARV